MAGNKFRFSLGSVLEVRQHEAEDARMAWVQARQRVADAEARVAEAEARLESVVGGGPGRGSVGLRQFRQLDAQRVAARRDVLAAERALDEARLMEGRLREAYTDRRRAEMTLDSLRKKELERHNLRIQEAEMAFLDEQAMMGHFKKSAASR